MAKRNANTGIYIPRRSPRLQKLAEEERKLAEEVKITDLSNSNSKEDFRALIFNKKSITVACREDRLPRNSHQGWFVVLYALVKKFIELLLEADITTISTLEKLTFEDVPVSETVMRDLLQKVTLTVHNLRSIAVKRNICHLRLFDVFAFKGERTSTDLFGNDTHEYTFKLPGVSILESISFEPGAMYSRIDDLEALKLFVVSNSLIKSIKVLTTEDHLQQLSVDSSKKAHMLDTLKLLSERHWDEYSEKLARLDVDSPLYIDLKARLWSQTVAKLLSDTGPGIFDKVHHGMMFNHIRSKGIDRVINCRSVIRP